MRLKEKRDMKPIVLKIGSMLAFSLAGFLYSLYKFKRIKPSSPPSSPCSSGGGRDQPMEELHDLSAFGEENSDNTYTQTTAKEISILPVGDNEGILLQEGNDLVNDVGKSGLGTRRQFSFGCDNDRELEIRNLRNMVQNLRQKEKILEVQLLEFYGLKEQEAAVMELRNRLKINHVESKLLTLKIESLQKDKKRLEAQVADHAIIMEELEAAKSKVKLLEMKIRLESQGNKEHILSLEKDVAKLRDEEIKACEVDFEMRKKLHLLKDLEVEVEKLKKENMRIHDENDELGKRLEATQILANSVLEDQETEALKEEGNRLRCENEDLTREIDQLQEDRFSEFEELVYIRWVNACLRYELRNYQPPNGKTVARDLSKTVSPESEKKAKQLILDYAQTESVDFDSELCSSSQASNVTNSSDLDDSTIETLSRSNSSSKKNKFFEKFRKLIRGKDVHKRRQITHKDSITFPEDWGSMDIEKLRRLKEEDIESVGNGYTNMKSYRYKSLGLGRSGSVGSESKNQLEMEPNSTRKSDLIKFAEALKDSGSLGTLHKKSASYSFG